MGYLHAGHLSLVRRARQRLGRSGKLVLSLYVNPAQFGPKEDFSRYPRDLRRDLSLCRKAAVDVVFAPLDAQMYPPGVSSTFVVENQLSRGMEGVSRPTHFRGVATVVAKLFNLVQPDIAVFGAKDYQQAAVVRRMARDLNFPVKIVVAPTVREPDGLALSSRNRYLTGALRQEAVGLWRAIQAARAAVKASRRPLRAHRLKKALRDGIEAAPSARVDYIEFFDPETLMPVPRVKRGTHLALAVLIGKTRLIDNARL
jgi:pantoate--beta-alanine ligase